MKLRHPWLIRGAGMLGAVLVRGWMATVRPKLEQRFAAQHPVNPRYQRYIYAFWHESILATTLFHTKIHMLISQHADGELIAQVARCLRVGTVRGSSTRGGGAAILEMLKVAKYSHLGITPDGPRGPRRKVQPGVIDIASRTGLPIIGFGAGFTDAWRAKSWDRFAIPKPQSTITYVTTPPLVVPAGLDRNGQEVYRQMLESRMLTATDVAERWAAGKPPASLPFTGATIAQAA